MKYCLRRTGGVAECIVISDGLTVKLMADGIEFGRDGVTGQNKLALAILNDYCQRKGLPPHVAMRHYSEFKWWFIADANDQTDITETQIREFLRK